MKEGKFSCEANDIETYLDKLKQTFRFRNLSKEHSADLKRFYEDHNIRSYFTMLMLTD